MNPTAPGQPACQRLLVVDDNRAIHEDFRKVFGVDRAGSEAFDDVEASFFGSAASPARAGMSFQFDSAYQGQEALELVRGGLDRGVRYPVAFLDVRMPPGWDGIETAAKIWEVDPDLQIVICTAYSDYSWDDMLARLGLSDRLVILKKPFDNVEVLQLACSLTRKWEFLQESKTKFADLERMVAARTAQIAQEQEKFRAIFENSPEGIFQRAADGRFLSANSALAAICGYASVQELLGSLADARQHFYADPAHWEEFQARLDREGVVRGFEMEIKCKDGSRKRIRKSAARVTASDGSLLFYQVFIVDISDQVRARQERDLMEVHLRQAQKLESVGQLAAGIAHEINTPVQYIGDNLRFISDAFDDLNQLLADHQRLAGAVHASAVTPELLASVEASARKADLPYLGVEVPKALRQSLDGVKHVANIVCAMKEFSHPGTKEKVALDLNHAIETTATVARTEWKYVAELVTDLAADLPPVPCLPGEFNQVILNLIVNAAHAVGDVVRGQDGAKGTIRISTRREGDWAVIRVSDTGGGIPEEIRGRIFEPFFTTKEVGKGTGQGLAIARSTIVKKHGGDLSFESEAGRGTTFIIRLPLAPAPAGRPEGGR